MSSAEVEININTAEIENKIEKTKEERLREIGKYMVSQLEQALEGEGSGRIYTIPGTNIAYQASAPGEFPAERTGLLRNSNFFILDVPSVFIGNPQFYGLLLEKGYHHPKSGRWIQRPWLSDVFSANIDVIKSIAGQGWF